MASQKKIRLIQTFKNFNPKKLEEKNFVPHICLFVGSRRNRSKQMLNRKSRCHKICNSKKISKMFPTSDPPIISSTSWRYAHRPAPPRGKTCAAFFGYVERSSAVIFFLHWFLCALGITAGTSLSGILLLSWMTVITKAKTCRFKCVFFSRQSSMLVPWVSFPCFSENARICVISRTRRKYSTHALKMHFHATDRYFQTALFEICVSRWVFSEHGTNKLVINSNIYRAILLSCVDIFLYF